MDSQSVDHQVTKSSSTLGSAKDIWSMINLSTSEEKNIEIAKSVEEDRDTTKPNFKVGETCSNIFTPSITHRNSSPSDSFVVIRSSPMEEFGSLQEILQDIPSASNVSAMVENIQTREEAEQKLIHILNENLKLKETVLKNNEAMKKNFNSLLTWQINVDSMLNNHKTKFSEIRQLVHQLKKENTELKLQLVNNITGSLIEKSYISSTSPDEQHIDKTVEEKSMITSSTQIPEEKVSLFDELNASSSESIQKSISEQKCNYQEEDKLQKDSQSLLDECNSRSSTQSVRKMENIFCVRPKSLDPYEEVEKSISMENMILSKISSSDQLKSSENSYSEPKMSESMVKSHISNNSNSDFEFAQNSLSQSDKQNFILNTDKMYAEIENNIKDLRNSFEKFEIINMSKVVCPKKHRFVTSIKQYNEQLQKLVEFYGAERTRFRMIQENLIKCEKIFSKIDLLADKTPENISKIQEAQSQIKKFQSQFLQDNVSYSDQNKKLIEIQKLYQQIFWDYNSLINEMEMLEEENFKLKSMEECVKEKDQVLENLTKHYVEKMRILSLKDKEFEEKEANLQLCRNNLEEKIKELEMKSNKLNESLAALNDERNKLKEEKNSLDRQSEMYETKRMTESMENLSLQTKLKERYDLELKNMQLVIDDLRSQLEKKTEECESTVVAVRMQLEHYKSDFETESAIKRDLMYERDYLEGVLKRHNIEPYS